MSQDNEAIQQLRRKCKELQDHLNIVQELVVSLDHQGRITAINRNGCRILGYSRDDLVGRSWFDAVIAETDRPNLKMVFADVLAGHSGGNVYRENDVITASGDVRSIKFHNTFIRDDNGHITGTLSSGVDVTDARRQKRKLAKLQARLNQTAGLSTLGEIAAGLAHELNQPLSAISTYTGACLRLLEQDDLKTMRLKQALEQVSQQAHRAGDVVARMRSLAQPPVHDRALVDCNALIRDLMDIIKADEQHSQVCTILDLEEPLQEVSVDPVLIQQVILNYVRNAIEALEATSAGDRRILIKTRSRGNAIRCSVIDNGHGVLEHAVEELFDPFFTTKEASTGMGLSICKTVIEQHGGQVDYQTKPGHGATFSFTIPIPAPNRSSPTRQ